MLSSISLGAGMMLAKWNCSCFLFVRLFSGILFHCIAGLLSSPELFLFIGSCLIVDPCWRTGSSTLQTWWPCSGAFKRPELCLLRSSLQGKWSSFCFLIFNYFSKHPRNNLSKNLKKIFFDKKTRHRLWALFADFFFLGILFSCYQRHVYLFVHIIFINKNQFPLPTL